MQVNSLPPFSALDPQAIPVQLDALLAAQRQQLSALLSQSEPSYHTLVPALEAMSEAVQRLWGPVSHLFGVLSTPAWRAAYNACLPKVTEYGVELSQNAELCAAYKAIAAREDFSALDSVQQKVVQDALRDFRLSGIDLPEAQKAQYKALSLELSELQSRFEEHVMDCVQAWQMPISDPARLDGMTAAAIDAARAKAEAKGLSGWLLTLDFPSYDAVISRANDRSLREALYRAYATRASREGGHAEVTDNGPLMLRILALRAEQAKLLGFDHFADLSLAIKMADSPAQVERFLSELGERARPFAERELAALQALAHADGVNPIAAWDVAYYSEKLREQTLGLSDEALRPYFAYPKVLQGLFDLLQQLYGLQIRRDNTVPTWHADAEFYRVYSAVGTEVGAFYLDPYARPESKRGGAWMDECLGRKALHSQLQLPVAYLVCNFTPPPASGGPTLITHDEVLTLYHEFGHGLHHLLTRINEGAVAGIHGVEWDAVELPSQFMENFCYEASVLQAFAKHWQTGESMPDSMVHQLKADRHFQAGLATLRQIEFALFDLRLHRNAPPASEAGILGLLNAVRTEVAVLTPPPENRMPWSFGHIFGGGYAAGYYSYKWAEVLSSDAYAAFEESDFAPATGAKFLQEILSAGGSRPAMENFVAFRGREPDVSALLRHCGLAA